MSIVVGMCGCGSSSSDPTANETTPTPKQPDATAADYAKQLGENPNISPEVKKVIGGGGR